MTRKLIVLARSYEEAEKWRRESGVHHRSMIYVSNERVLRGLTIHPFQIIKVGRWFDHPHGREIEQQLNLGLLAGAQVVS